MANIINNSWDSVLKQELSSKKYIELNEFLENEYSSNTIFPSYDNIFNALKLTPYENVKVVILGQDPYHNHNQAHGLSFSVQEGTKIPPSLNNIFKEMQDDVGKDIPNSGDLTYLAKQGVLLLNATLTVVAHNPNSHSKIGWQSFTDNIISHVNDSQSPVVFILWGSYAQSKSKLIDSSKHLIINSVHPSPLSSYRGFFGSKPFSKCNEFLLKNNIAPIVW